MNELTLEDGQFMGNTLRRTQVFLASRRFTAIPVKLDAAQAVAVDMGKAQQITQQQLLDAQQLSAQGQQLYPAPPPVTAKQVYQNQQLLNAHVQRAALAASPPIMKVLIPNASGQSGHPQLFGPMSSPMKSTPNQTLKRLDTSVSGQKHGKSVIDTSILERFKQWVQGTGPEPDVSMAGSVFDDASEDMTGPPHPERTAYEHGRQDRAVPLIRLEATPAFFLNDTVGMAMANAIAAVCDTKRGKQLAEDVHRMRDAVYRPLGMYKPDTDGPWTGDPNSSSLFHRQTIHLDKEWDLDIRHATGAYHAGGRTWLGVFVHGIAVRGNGTGRDMPNPSNALTPMSPNTKDEERYFLAHRGQVEPTGLFFDLFVPVEPEIVTEEWGWGDDLEELTKARETNAARDAKANSVEGYEAIPANKWDKKAKTHKNKRQLNLTQIEIDREARVLGERYMDTLKERERARQVLYSYAWKALMLGVMECRQLTVEKY